MSTEVLRVSIGYRSTRSKLFRLFNCSVCFGFRSKRCPNNGADGRVQGRGAQITVPTSHSIFQQRDHSRAEVSFRLCILTGEWALSAVHIAGNVWRPGVSCAECEQGNPLSTVAGGRNSIGLVPPSEKQAGQLQLARWIMINYFPSSWREIM